MKAMDLLKSEVVVHKGAQQLLIDFYRDFRTQIGDKALTKHTFF
jgi:hypothetical protein